MRWEGKSTQGGKAQLHSFSPSDVRDALFSRSAYYSCSYLIRQLKYSSSSGLVMARALPRSSAVSQLPTLREVPPELGGWHLGHQCRWQFGHLFPTAFLFSPSFHQNLSPDPTPPPSTCVGLALLVLRVLQLFAAIFPKKVQRKSCSLQMLPLIPDVSSKPLCLHTASWPPASGPGCQARLCRVPLLRCGRSALPFPDRLDGSEDEENSASGFLSSFCALLPLPSW